MVAASIPHPVFYGRGIAWPMHCFNGCSTKFRCKTIKAVIFACEIQHQKFGDDAALKRKMFAIIGWNNSDDDPPPMRFAFEVDLPKEGNDRQFYKQRIRWIADFTTGVRQNPKLSMVP